MAENKLWFSIDRGGTFTDVFCQEASGKQHVLKLLSVDPSYKDAPTEGIRRVLELATGKPHPRDALVDTSRIASIRMGTTVATNALLERKGDRCALVTTKGFKDLLHIGNQSRPNIFDLEIKCPGVLYEHVVEVDERVALVQQKSASLGGDVVTGVTGEQVEVVKPIDLAALRRDLSECLDKGIKAVAVMLLHSYTFRAHERAIGDLCKELGFTQVSLSSEVMPMVKAVPRGLTSCADAYLNPSIQRYLTTFKVGFDAGLKDVELLFMQSDGGLAGVDRFNGFQAILSGPAGGVVGYACTTYKECGCKPVIGFDMGGTSTDVSRYAGQYEHVFETTTAGVTIQAPQLDINTVAAGGGSCLQFLSGLFRVGPESSSAFPGPTCYRRGGPLSVTDANLQLGRIIPARFPHIFGPNENEPLDADATRAAFEKVMAEVNAFQTGDAEHAKPMTCDEVAYGFIKVANEAMCRPIRALTSARGHDIRAHVLSCFGGAGGQHACAVARSLGISTIFVHRYASILSAYGLFLAEVAEEAQEPAASTLDSDQHAMLATRLSALEVQAVDKLLAQGYSRDRIQTQAFLNLRYEGTDSAVMTPLAPEARAPQPVKTGEVHSFESSFVASYKREFGFVLTGRKILVDDLRVRAVGRNLTGLDAPTPAGGRTAKAAAVPEETVSVYFEGGRQDTAVYALSALQSGCEIKGPAILLDNISTILVEPGCTALITLGGDVKIAVGAGEVAKVSAELDLVQLSIFSHRFMSIAEQMGRTLQRTSISTNIKERLDFSCALFDEKGGLVANAPHIPVHLGSMQDAVRHQVKVTAGDLHEGDVLMTNHPCAGGTHLPDITIITPVFANGAPVFFVASRGHHADIGGITPGSMPPHSKTLLEEGMNCESFRLVAKGVWQEEGVKALLLSPAKHPGCSGARNVADNLSDLRAQVAANRKGIGLVQELIGEFGLDVVQAYMQHIQANAEVAVRELLSRVAAEKGSAAGSKRKSDGGAASVTATLEAEDAMDDGTPIKLKVSVNGADGSALFDFSGTGPQVFGNLNAPKAVTYSAIIYCMRCMVARDVPLNQGCLKPCTVVIPEGSILAPGSEAAVVGGNVLTSQRVVDVILKAFSACAASQGCMNNVTFGDETFGYYETIAGGAGAGPSWHGRSGVHTHMTNTRITDVEIMERRYPILVREFGLRPNSGGAGAFRGGDGTVRELLFRRRIHLSLLTERRTRAPYGMAGGEDGSKGENLLIKSDGSSSSLGGKNSVMCESGDALRLLAPGGGGYGAVGSDVGKNQGGAGVSIVGHGAAGSLSNYEQMQTSA